MKIERKILEEKKEKERKEKEEKKKLEIMLGEKMVILQNLKLSIAKCRNKQKCEDIFNAYNTIINNEDSYIFSDKKKNSNTYNYDKIKKSITTFLENVNIKSLLEPSLFRNKSNIRDVFAKLRELETNDESNFWIKTIERAKIYQDIKIILEQQFT